MHWNINMQVHVHSKRALFDRCNDQGKVTEWDVDRLWLDSEMGIVWEK